MKLKLFLILLCITAFAGSIIAQTNPPMVVTRVSAASLSFGGMPIGTSTGGVELDVNFNNEGHVAFTVSGPFQITFDWRGYNRGKSAESDFMGFAAIYVNFSPTGAGPASGALTITTSGGSKTVPLSGTGIPLPVLTVSPSALSFTNVPIHSALTKSFTLKGTNVVADTKVTFTGSFGGGGTYTAAQVNAGVQIPITYYATKSSETGLVTITTPGGFSDSGAPDIVKTVSLSGSGATGPVDPDMQNAIKSDNQQECVAEPIQLGTGTYEYAHSDFNIPDINTSLKFARYYNSLNNSLSSPVGYGWSHSYNYSVTVVKDPWSGQDERWNVKYPDGHMAVFVPTNFSDGSSSPLYSGTTDSLVKDGGIYFTLYTKDNHQYHFTAAGQLEWISDLNGNYTRLTYTNGDLSQITGPGGRAFKIAYVGGNIAGTIVIVNSHSIASVTDPLNRTCYYSYNSTGDLISVKDANGNTTSFTYDVNHRMLSATDPLGNKFITNTYDTQGRVTKQLDAYNQATTIAYNFPATGDATVTNPDSSQMIAHHDNAYRRTYVKDELGFTKTYTYDANGNENSFTDENAQKTTRQLDKQGNLLLNNAPGSIITKINYNAFNSPLQVTDPNGNATTLTYDYRNNLTGILSADATSQSFTFTNNGLRGSVKDARGNTTTFGYSAYGDLVSVTAPNGTKTYGYDAAGRAISFTDENGGTTTTTYDNNDNVVLIKDALGNTTSFRFNANNKLLSVTDKRGNTTVFTYDKKSRLLTTTDASGSITKNTYDVRDRLLTTTDANSNIITFTYDKKGRRTATTNALGSTQSQFDGAGNLLKVTDGTNKTTSYRYTPAYKIKTITDGMGNVTTYTYDKNNNLTVIADPLNRKTTYGFDVMNRLIYVFDAMSKRARVIYDENGNKKIVTDPNGHQQTYSYDAANRLTSHLDAAGNKTAFTFDATGNITAINKPNGTITKTYDALNRLLTVTNSTGDNYKYTYDANNNLLTTASNAGTAYMVYDKANRLTLYTDPNNKKIMYSYYAGGNRHIITYPGNKTVSYSYDKANNLKNVADWLNHTFTYTYDAAGRVTQLLYPNGVHCDYTFDAAGRLTGKNNTLSAATVIAGSNFTLDAVGNRLTEQRQGAVPANLKPASRVYSYGTDDRMLKDSVWTYVNDNAGNRTSEAMGNVKASYTFTVDNRLSKLVDTAGKTVNFTYDAWGNRINRTLGTDNKRYVVDAGTGLSQVLQVTDASRVVRSQYVYGPDLLERVDSTGNVLYYHYDGQHNTVALTNGAGVVTDTYTYDPFGTMLTHQGNTNQPFTFLGQFGVEQESPSLYYARARYYDAANGRFLGKDEYPDDMANSQTINRYAYSTNNPISKYDYTGWYGDMDWISDGESSLDRIMDKAIEVDAFLSSFPDIFGKYTAEYEDAIKFYSKEFMGNKYISGDIVKSQKAFGEIFGKFDFINSNFKLYDEVYNHFTAGSTVRGSTYANALIGPVVTILAAGAVTLGAPIIGTGLLIAGAGYAGAHLIWGDKIDHYLDKQINFDQARRYVFDKFIQF